MYIFFVWKTNKIVHIKWAVYSQLIYIWQRQAEDRAKDKIGGCNLLHVSTEELDMIILAVRLMIILNYGILMKSRNACI